ncbi:S-adenosyl-L-methionine-dependent methyltransferase [Elaphomyces granulatus]
MYKRRGKSLRDGRSKTGSNGPRRDWQEVDKYNEKYERFYNELGIVPAEDREAFWAALRRDLPNSFRFTGSKSHALSVQQRLKEFYVPRITSIQHNGEYVEPPRPVLWYPDQLAWSMTTSKSIVRRFAPFASFQKFLVAETEVGNISRQEVVSMVPPLLIDIRPGMTVLDMCAAPGSKSAQLMEMIHAGEEEGMKMVFEKMKNGDDTQSNDAADDLEDDGRSTGLLIANDSDYKRAHLLIHQMKRLNSPNLIVTNHDATMYPSIKLPPLPTPPGEPQKNRYLKFDRILADVPCSGDGTTRKNSNVWMDWTPGNAVGLHATQVRILVRALQMLKVGGRAVYSTCSMNPVENEAVVASTIERCGGLGNVEIIDCSEELPGLKRASGLRSWKVMDKDGRIWNSWVEVEEYRQKHGVSGLGRLAQGMFPATGEDAGPPLERCFRIYPHLQDTGGFFVAVLMKKSEIRAKPEDPSKVIPKASIAAVMEELDGKQRNGTAEPLEKINALDELVPPGETLEGKNATVAEGSHQPPYSITLDSTLSSRKRTADFPENDLPVKRTKLEDGTEIIIGDRPVHRPNSALPETNEENSFTTDSKQGLASSQPPQMQTHPTRQRKGSQSFEEPFKYIDRDVDELKQIFAFYDISDRFPRDRFMVRNAQGHLSKTIYYSSPLARDILTENEGRGIKFVHCGVKMFVKQDVQRPDVCRWRIQTDGLRILESWVGQERTITLYKKETLRKLLIEMFPRLDREEWRKLDEIGERARDIDMGCYVLRIEPRNTDDGLKERMVFPVWRSLHSFNLMLPKEDRRALLLRLYNDSTPLVNTTQKRESLLAKSAPEIPDNVVDPSEPDSRELGEIDDFGGSSPPVAETEDNLIKHEDLALGQEVQDMMSSRETYQIAGGEEDRFNTTV